MEKEENNGLGFIEIIQLLLSHWIVIVLITAICGVMGYFVGIKTRSITYIANSSFLVRINGINTSSSGMSTSESSSWSSDISTSRYLLTDCVELMLSDACLEEVATTVNANLDTDKFTKANVAKYFSFAYDGEESLKITVNASSKLNKEEAMALCNQMVSKGRESIEDYFTDGGRATVKFEVLSRAERSNTKTTSSSVTLKTAIGIFAGVVLSAFAVLIINMLDNRIRSEEELAAKLQLPVLACIPAAATNNKKTKGGTYGA